MPPPDRTRAFFARYDTGRSSPDSSLARRTSTGRAGAGASGAGKGPMATHPASIAATTMAAHPRIRIAGHLTTRQGASPDSIASEAIQAESRRYRRPQGVGIMGAMRYVVIDFE